VKNPRTPRSPIAEKALAAGLRDTRKQVKAGLVPDGVYARAIALVADERRLTPEQRRDAIEEVDRIRVLDEADDAIAAGDLSGWDADLYLVREGDLVYVGAPAVERFDGDVRDVATIERWAAGHAARRVNDSPRSRAIVPDGAVVAEVAEALAKHAGALP
jgi:hypothetical protein